MLTARTLALGALVAAGGCGRVLGLEPKPRPALAVAAPAPAFALENHDGTRVALGGELADHDVVLVFYRGHW